MQEKKFIIESFFVVVILLMLLMGFITTILLMYKRKQHAFLHQFEQSQLEMQELTLRSISRELHDNVGSQLALSRLLLTTTELDAEHPAAKKILSAADMIGRILDQVRDVSKNLSLDIIRNVGLTEAIGQFLQQLENNGAHTIEFTVKGEYDFMDEQKEIIVFRIFQEAINNIIRHANAKKINVLIDCSTDQIFHLCIIDDGKGFDTNPRKSGVIASTGSGLTNMQMRARVLAASFTIESSPGNGTTIQIIMPV